MKVLKALFKFIYTLLAGATTIALSVFMLDNPVKQLHDYSVSKGVIDNYEHVKYRGYKTYIKLVGSQEQYRLRLNRGKRSAIKKGANVKVWFSNTLLSGTKVKQINVNDVIVKKYNYSYVKNMQTQSIALVCMLLAGFIFLYRGILIQLIKAIRT